MLKSEIRLRDLGNKPHWRGGRVVFGESWIEPFQHAALESILICTEGQWFLCVRERTSENFTKSIIYKEVDFDTYVALFQEFLNWPLDYVTIEVVEGASRLRVRAGVLGTAPIYCHPRGDAVSMSWDYADLLTTSFPIDIEIAAHQLALSTFYAARTICVGIISLTERASLYMEPGLARHSYPEPVEERGSSSSNTDPVGFGQALREVIAMRPIPANRAGLELSGGMDSASVAIALKRVIGSVESRGVILDGDEKSFQVLRRQEIVNRLDLRDGTASMADFPPALNLHPAARKKEHPLGEFYLEAFESIWSNLQRKGVEFLFTGVGGDELFPLFPGEKDSRASIRKEKLEAMRVNSEQILSPRALTAARSMRAFDAPAGPVSMSSLLAHLCRAPYMLRHGLWPVNPLSDPALTEYCHGMPYASRASREAMRVYLNNELGIEIFQRNYIKETFSRVLPEQIVREHQAIAAQLQECALADLGIVNQRAVLRLLSEVVSTRSEDQCAPLAFFLWMERFARQVA